MEALPMLASPLPNNLWTSAGSHLVAPAFALLWGMKLEVSGKETAALAE